MPDVFLSEATGLTNSKLSIATATPSDVLDGSNNRYEWGCELYIINNPTIPFTFSATTNGSWSWAMDLPS